LLVALVEISRIEISAAGAAGLIETLMIGPRDTHILWGLTLRITTDKDRDYRSSELRIDVLVTKPTLAGKY